MKWTAELLRAEKVGTNSQDSYGELETRQVPPRLTTDGRQKVLRGSLCLPNLGLITYL